MSLTHLFNESADSFINVQIFKESNELLYGRLIRLNSHLLPKFIWYCQQKMKRKKKVHAYVLLAFFFQRKKKYHAKDKVKELDNLIIVVRV